MKESAHPLSSNQRESGELKPRNIPTFEECFPSSEKCVTAIDFQDTVLEVPYRRINLTDGTHFDLYDTTGPQGLTRVQAFRVHVQPG